MNVLKIVGFCERRKGKNLFEERGKSVAMIGCDPRRGESLKRKRE